MLRPSPYLLVKDSLGCFFVRHSPVTNFFVVFSITLCLRLLILLPELFWNVLLTSNFKQALSCCQIELHKNVLHSAFINILHIVPTFWCTRLYILHDFIRKSLCVELTGMKWKVQMCEFMHCYRYSHLWWGSRGCCESWSPCCHPPHDRKEDESRRP